MQRLVERRQRGGQAHNPLAPRFAIGPIDDLSRKRNVARSIGEIDDGPASRLQALARLHERFPYRRVAGLGLAVEHFAQQQHFGCPACAAFGAEQARRQHARLVHDKQITWVYVIDDVAEHAIFERAGHAVHAQQPASVAIGGGLLRDQLLRQLVFEIARFHGILPQICR